MESKEPHDINKASDVEASAQTPTERPAMTLAEALAREGNGTLCPTAIMIRDGKVLRGLRNYTKEKWKDISVWTTPGGRSDPGETLEEALRREVKEEVGITDFTIDDFIGEVPGAKEGDVVPVFLCSTKSEATLMEPEKFSAWKWVPFEEYLAETPKLNPAAKQMIEKYLVDHGIAR